jgi:Domain of unknown function (DUF1996)
MVGVGLEVMTMKRWPLLALAALAVMGTALATVGSASSAANHGRGYNYFAVVCDFSHRNADDPIVHPGHPNLSHNHTYFGNRTTNAFSTPASLRASGRTTCGRLGVDTAAYWAPTLLVDSKPVRPLGAIAYYVRRTFGRVDAFPAGLKVIAGNAAASRAQSRRVTFWSCDERFGVERSTTVPTCLGGRRSGLRLHINFPNGWDGDRLDSANHKSHMAYSSDGDCPGSHPVEVPALSLVIYYGVAGGPGTELASGGQFSGHADFINAWNQRALERLVDTYLNGFGHRYRR